MAKLKRTMAYYSGTVGMATWVNMKAGQTKEAKEIAMRVMVIRIMIDEMMIMTKARCMLY